MIKRKFITVSACIALMLTALSGCSGNASSTDNNSVNQEQVDKARQKYVDDNIRIDSYEELKDTQGFRTGFELDCINGYAYLSVKGGLTKASEFDNYCKTISKIHNNDDIQKIENKNHNHNKNQNDKK